MEEIRLSPSTLNMFLDCERCFWLEKVKGLKRPRGIFPSLPGGMDRVIKSYFDSFRKKRTLPPELLRGDFEGAKLFEDQERLDRWRDWRTGLCWRDGEGSTLFGALDDLLVKDGRYIPFDYKTKGSVTTPEDAVKYYQNQLDCYALLLEKNSLPTAGHGFLIYYSPKMAGENGKMLFEIQAIKIAASPERALSTFGRAIQTLKGPMPGINFRCEYCSFFSRGERLGSAAAKGRE